MAGSKSMLLSDGLMVDVLIHEKHFPNISSYAYSTSDIKASLIGPTY